MIDDTFEPIGNAGNRVVDKLDAHMPRKPKTEIQKIEQTAPPAIATGSFLNDLIARAALDPSFDVQKFQQLMTLKNQEEDRDRLRVKEDREFRALSEFNEHMAQCQNEMSAVAANAINPTTKSKYATYTQLDRAIRPIYTKHGFRISYGTADGAPEGEVRVTARISRLTHYEDYHLDMPNDGKGARGGDVMSKTHAQGAAMTYGKRYLLGMIFNIAISQDTDGVPPPDATPCTNAEIEKVRKALVDAKADEKIFCDYFKIAAVEDLPKRDYDRALAAIAKSKAERLKREREAKQEQVL